LVSQDTDDIKMNRKRGSLSFLDDMKLPHDLEDTIHQFMMMPLDQRVENFGDLIELFEDEDIDEVAYYAIKYNNLRLLQYAISRGTNKRSVLVWASQEGHLDIVKYLISQDANVNVYMNDALLRAIKSGHVEVVKYLVSAGADVDNGAVEIATRRGDLDIIKYLVSRGAEVDPTLLETASVYGGHLDIVQYLVLEEGVDVNADNDEALIAASERGHLEIVKFLVSQGADANNDYVLQVARINDQLDVVAFLVSHRAHLPN
jgi:ankyrin repeat protein